MVADDLSKTDADFGNLDSSYWEYYVTLIFVSCFHDLAFVEESYICVLLEPFLQVLPFPIEFFFSPGKMSSIASLIFLVEKLGRRLAFYPPPPSVPWLDCGRVHESGLIRR